jgi:hypothetical protein
MCIGQLAILGINTANYNSSELTLLHSILPKLEAYHELVHRQPHADMTGERAYRLVLLTTDDISKAEKAEADIEFALTPYE